MEGNQRKLWRAQYFVFVPICLCLVLARGTARFLCLKLPRLQLWVTADEVTLSFIRTMHSGSLKPCQCHAVHEASGQSTLNHSSDVSAVTSVDRGRPVIRLREKGTLMPNGRTEFDSQNPRVKRELTTASWSLITHTHTHTHTHTQRERERERERETETETETESETERQTQRQKDRETETETAISLQGHLPWPEDSLITYTLGKACNLHCQVPGGDRVSLLLTLLFLSG